MAAINAQLVGKNNKSDGSKAEKGDSKFSNLMSEIFKSEESQDTKSVKVEGNELQGNTNFIFSLGIEKECNENKIDETKFLIDETKSSDDYIDDSTLNLCSLQYQFNSTKEEIEIAQEEIEITEKSSGIEQQTIVQGLSSIMQDSDTLTRDANTTGNTVQTGEISVVENTVETEDTIITANKTNILNQHVGIVSSENSTVESYYINLNNSIQANKIKQLDSVKSELQNILIDISNLDQNDGITLLKEVEDSIKNIISQIANYEKIDINTNVEQDLINMISQPIQEVNEEVNKEAGKQINYLQDGIDNLISKVTELISNENDTSDTKIQELINVLQGNSQNSISNTKEEHNEYDTINNLRSRIQNKIEFKHNIAMEVTPGEYKNQQVNNYKNEFALFNDANDDNGINQVKIVEEKLISVIKDLKVIQNNISTVQNKETITWDNSSSTYNQQYGQMVDLSRVNRIFELQKKDTTEINSDKSMSKEKVILDNNSKDKILNLNFAEMNEETKFIDKTLNSTLAKLENLKFNNSSFIEKGESTKGNLAEISDKDKPQVENIKSTLQNLDIFNTNTQEVSNDLEISNTNLKTEVQIENFDEIVKQLEMKTDGIKNNEEMTMSLKLKPQELGELNIQIQKKDNEMLAKLIVNSNETKELIQKNMHLIKTSLEGANVKIIEINVDDKTSYANNFSFNSQNEESSPNNDFYNEERGNHSNSSKENTEEFYTEEDNKIFRKSATIYSNNQVNILT